MIYFVFDPMKLYKFYGNINIIKTATHLHPKTEYMDNPFTTKKRRNQKNEYMAHHHHLEHHHINNVTMIINNEHKEKHEMNDSMDTMDTNIEPHIVNDEESYMHSLTLAQVECAALNTHYRHQSSPNAAVNRHHRHYRHQSSPNALHKGHYLNKSRVIPEIYPNPQNQRIMVSNPFHIESVKSEQTNTIKILQNNIVIHPIHHLNDDDNANLSDTMQLNLPNDNDNDSIKAQITPRINSELLTTPRDLELTRNDTLSANTAIIHPSRNTFDPSQTIDISTLKLGGQSIPGSSEEASDEDSEESSKDTSSLKNTLSKKLKKLQRLKAEHRNIYNKNMYKTPTRETSTISMTSRQALAHEYGPSPSDLQEYFAMIANKKKSELLTASPLLTVNAVNHFNNVSPTNKTCQSSTDTETFYYKDNQKHVEHHILMPPLDEKDSDYGTSLGTNTNDIKSINIIPKPIHNTIHNKIPNDVITDSDDIHNDEDNNNTMLTPQLTSKPSIVDHGYIQQMRARLESTHSVTNLVNNNNNNNKNKNNDSLSVQNMNNNKNQQYDNNKIVEHNINMDELDLTLSVMSSTTPLVSSRWRLTPMIKLWFFHYIYIRDRFLSEFV